MKLLRKAFGNVSYFLEHHPVKTNIFFTFVVGFWGDVICQTVYEPCTLGAPQLTREVLPAECKDSWFVVSIPSPYLAWKHRKGDKSYRNDGKMTNDVLVDLRRSVIFCSYNAFLGTFFFLGVYKRLDRILPRTQLTKRTAFMKGFMSWSCAQVYNAFFMLYLTSIDHFFIYRDGRDGRRRVEEDDPKAESIMGRRYKFVPDTSFSFEEYYKCVKQDTTRKLLYDYPDIVLYGFAFWSINWLPLFYYIPGHFRLAYSQCVQVIWSGIMSHLCHRTGAHLRAEQVAANV
ncbi:hypothetical protein AGDE_01590 [Angomonas deanei]|nr:hypothetical protein AGDE_01590 [Angomonas deanei]|eukprot:EPY42333.1 hypothetical protein AGDE_01590 [Angomonas deanei]